MVDLLHCWPAPGQGLSCAGLMPSRGLSCFSSHPGSSAWVVQEVPLPGVCTRGAPGGWVSAWSIAPQVLLHSMVVACSAILVLSRLVGAHMQASTGWAVFIWTPYRNWWIPPGGGVSLFCTLQVTNACGFGGLASIVLLDRSLSGIPPALHTYG